MKNLKEGVIRTRDFLFATGIVANHKRIRRLLRLMGIMAIYPRENLSRPGQAKYIRPYLLMDLSCIMDLMITWITILIDFATRELTIGSRQACTSQ